LGEDGKPVRGRQSVTWHPLFPAMVAVWFGALFGLGALAVRVGLIEQLALATGIDRIIPAAAPPLGTNARILIALMLAMAGGVLGAVIGTRLARSKPALRARRAEAAAARAEWAEPAEVATPATKATRAVLEPSFIDISQLDIEGELKIYPQPAREAEWTEAPVERSSYERVDTGENASTAGPAHAFERPLDPVSFPLPASFPAPGGAAAQRLIGAKLESLSHLELIERLALSLQKRREEGSAGGAPDVPSATATSVAASPSAGEGQAVSEPQAPSYYPPAPQQRLPRVAGAPTVASPRLPSSGSEPGKEGSAEGGYGSLLGIARKSGGASDASSMNPASGHPSQLHASPAAAMRQSPAATERALRDALSALQRMSGAA
jgi:hypothetical protein